MATYTGADVIALAMSIGAAPELARIMAAAAMAEGGGDSEAVGDSGTSLGAYQINDIHGLSREQRFDLAFATRWMHDHEFARAYTAGLDRSYTDETLCRWVCMAAERPYGWNGPNAPGLDSPAADRYAAEWRALGDSPMSDLRHAFLAEIRRYTGAPYVFGAKGPDTFDCSGLLTACGRVVGVDLGDPNYTSADALKQYCDPIDASEAQPGDLLLFSQTYGDTGPDYATHCGASLGAGTGRMLDTHEPAGVGETNIYLPYWQSHLMGAYRPRAFAETPPAPAPAPAPDADPCAALISQVGWLTGDLADIFQRHLDAARSARTKKVRDAELLEIQNAISTLRRGGS